MNQAKIRLSAQEMELVTNTAWILTKARIMEKTTALLGTLQQRMARILQVHAGSIPAEVTESNAKISKGENYKGLPYLILDYPRRFDRDAIFAIRTMFWWGHFFSITLHLSGRYQACYAPKLVAGYNRLAEQQFYYCINDDPWEHHFETSNYQMIETAGKERFAGCLSQNGFLKIANKIPLSDWDQADDRLAAHFTQLAALLFD
ncbi:MAG TPA: hypothetical protein VFS36_12315 [Chitinophagaceae bacterium]|jgi:hypothetical protein|nr:hypothetical protein [Chitinophagaceae bacterium]